MIVSEAHAFGTASQLAVFYSLLVPSASTPLFSFLLLMLNLFFIATSFLFVRWTGQAKCYWEINMDWLNGFGENCKFWELINRVMLWETPNWTLCC